MKRHNVKTKIKLLLINIFKFFAVIFMFSFLLFNFASSQTAPPLFFRMVKEDKNSAVSFLRQIKNHPSFHSFLEINKNIYGKNIEREVFLQDIKRKQMITEYESLLLTNPASRDTLYNLYLLYREDGNDPKAYEYLRKARKIDPIIQ